MNEIFILSFAIAGFVAVILIGREFLKKNGKENEVFTRNHVEDAMRIKAKQYEDNGY
jgi:hypothetical protein